MNNKYLRFIAGLFIIPIFNLHNYFTAKWVYIWITPRQLWYMVYRDMSRIKAAEHIAKLKKNKELIFN